MDHAETLELIELAAVEPDGLERLMAGDTPESAAVAGHLAGCDACVAELARIRRASSIAREVIGSLPDPALKARTLTFVREVGRDRSGAVAAPDAVAQPSPSSSVAPAIAVAPAPAPTGAPAPMTIHAHGAAPVPLRSRASRQWLRYAGLAAALAVALGLGFVAGGLRASPDAQAREITVLQETTQGLLAVGAQPDAVRIGLAPTAAGGQSSGSLVYSPSNGQLVMVAEGLAAPPDGMEYGCWVEVAGTRRRIGRMYTGGDLQSWAGPVDGLADLPADAVFGVSLAARGGAGGEPVLTGSASG